MTLIFRYVYYLRSNIHSFWVVRRKNNWVRPLKTIFFSARWSPNIRFWIRRDIFSLTCFFVERTQLTIVFATVCNVSIRWVGFDISSFATCNGIPRFRTYAIATRSRSDTNGRIVLLSTINMIREFIVY